MQHGAHGQPVGEVAGEIGPDPVRDQVHVRSLKQMTKNAMMKIVTQVSIFDSYPIESDKI